MFNLFISILLYTKTRKSRAHCLLRFIINVQNSEFRILPSVLAITVAFGASTYNVVEGSPTVIIQVVALGQTTIPLSVR